MLTVSETDLGTGEPVWCSTPAVTGAAEIVWGKPGRIAVLAPHPDDETLAVGGTLSMLVRRGFEVDVIAVTDGEGSHPTSRTTTPAQLREVRAEEQLRALGDLGIPSHRVTRLGVPDGHVRSDVDLPERLATLFADVDIVLAPFAEDGHPDHDATGQAATSAARRVGVRLVSYLVWAWHWATPATELPWSRFRRSSLDVHAQQAKANAIARFTSQIADLSSLPGDERILPAPVLRRFFRDFETMIE